MVRKIIDYYGLNFSPQITSEVEYLVIYLLDNCIFSSVQCSCCFVLFCFFFHIIDFVVSYIIIILFIGYLDYKFILEICSLSFHFVIGNYVFGIFKFMNIF